MNNAVLITGASSGIGYELAKLFARDGHNLVLVARRGESLKEIKDNFERRYKIDVLTLSQDLAYPGAVELVLDAIEHAGKEIEILVNNAGAGNFGHFVETDWERERHLINLNIVALTQLTKAFAKLMVKRGSGKILNVASVASFQPGPLMAVYYASKAYVLSFSEAIANELKGTGVTMTVLCPGATASGFQKAAWQEDSKLIKGKRLATSEEVARYGYRALQAGKTIAIHGWKNKFLIELEKITPRALVTAMVRRLQEK